MKANWQKGGVKTHKQHVAKSKSKSKTSSSKSSKKKSGGGGSSKKYAQNPADVAQGIDASKTTYDPVTGKESSVTIKGKKYSVDYSSGKAKYVSSGGGSSPSSTQSTTTSKGVTLYPSSVKRHTTKDGYSVTTASYRSAPSVWAVSGYGATTTLGTIDFYEKQAREEKKSQAFYDDPTLPSYKRAYQKDMTPVPFGGGGMVKPAPFSSTKYYAEKYTAPIKEKISSTTKAVFPEWKKPTYKKTATIYDAPILKKGMSAETYELKYKPFVAKTEYYGKQTKEVGRGYYNYFREKPVSATGSFLLGAGTTIATRRFPTTMSFTAPVLATTYGGTKAVQYAMTPKEGKGYFIGETAGELSAFGLGAKAVPTKEGILRFKETAKLRYRTFKHTGSFKHDLDFVKTNKLTAGKWDKTNMNFGELYFSESGLLKGKQTKLVMDKGTKSYYTSEQAEFMPGSLSIKPYKPTQQSQYLGKWVQRPLKPETISLVREGYTGQETFAYKVESPKQFQTTLRQAPQISLETYRLLHPRYFSAPEKPTLLKIAKKPFIGKKAQMGVTSELITKPKLQSGGEYWSRKLKPRFELKTSEPLYTSPLKQKVTTVSLLSMKTNLKFEQAQSLKQTQSLKFEQALSLKHAQSLKFEQAQSLEHAQSLKFEQALSLKFEQAHDQKLKQTPELKLKHEYIDPLKPRLQFKQREYKRSKPKKPKKPAISPLVLPRFKVGATKPKIMKPSKQKKKYAPTLRAVFLGIKGKRKGLLSGLEERGL